MLECKLSDCCVELLGLLLLSIAAERLTEIIVDSKLLGPVREFVSKRAHPDYPIGATHAAFFGWLSALLKCGYCVSVWVAMPLAYCVDIRLISSLTRIPVLSWVVTTMVIHGLANLYHVIYTLAQRGRARYIQLELTTPEEAGDDDA